MRWYTVGWVVIGAAVLALESVALIDPGRMDTASENWWYAQEAVPALRVIGVGFLVWLGWHLFGRRR